MSLTLEFFYQKTRYTYNLDLLTASTTLNKKNNLGISFG